MQFQFELPNNIIFIALSLLGWGLIITLHWRQYLKQQEKPAVWKIVVIALVGMFSISITTTLFQTPAKISILPLGVFFIYVLLRKPSWQIYRKYAWIGFWSNFILLTVTLLSASIHHFVYPKEKLSTYIANINDAAIIQIHPTASEAVFNKEQFKKQLQNLEPIAVESDLWYQASVFESEPYYHKERFPYQLIGVEPRWGSGLRTVIYVEDNGKGFLITTPDQQYYYRSKESFLEGVSQ